MHERERALRTETRSFLALVKPPNATRRESTRAAGAAALIARLKGEVPERPVGIMAVDAIRGNILAPTLVADN